MEFWIIRVPQYMFADTTNLLLPLIQTIFIYGILGLPHGGQLLFPGLGSLYIHRIPSGFFTVSWTAVILYFSHFLEALQYTFMGSFDQAIAVLDRE